MAGHFHTKGRCQLLFKLPELNYSAKILAKAYVTNMKGTYNMILGRDVLYNLGIILDFKNLEVE